MSNNNKIMLNGKSYFISDLKTYVLTGRDLKNLKHLPEEYCKLTDLLSLRIRNTKLISLPPCIVKLKNLTDLEIGFNKYFTHLPKNIGELKNLVEIYLSDNESLTHLPESIGELTNLEELTIKECKLIKILPESIGKLKNLKKLVCNGTSVTKLPKSFKNLKSDIKIYYNYGVYKRDELIKLLTPKRVSINTDLFNKNIIFTNKISNIPRDKRCYLNIISNVKNDGELRRLYNKDSINRYMKGRNNSRRLHSDWFTMNQVKLLKNTNIVNKNVYLRNINIRLRNSTTLNNFNKTVERIKTNLPSNISRTDVNNIVRKMKPQVLQRIFNKLKNSPPNNRVRIMNIMKNRGLMNNSDIIVMKKKLLGPNFVRNSKKPSPITTTTRKLMNSNNARKSPYI